MHTHAPGTDSTTNRMSLLTAERPCCSASRQSTARAACKQYCSASSFRQGHIGQAVILRIAPFTAERSLYHRSNQIWLVKRFTMLDTSQRRHEIQLQVPSISLPWSRLVFERALLSAPRQSGTGPDRYAQHAHSSLRTEVTAVNRFILPHLHMSRNVRLARLCVRISLMHDGALQPQSRQAAFCISLIIAAIIRVEASYSKA